MFKEFLFWFGRNLIGIRDVLEFPRKRHQRCIRDVFPFISRDPDNGSIIEHYTNITYFLFYITNQIYIETNFKHNVSYISVFIAQHYHFSQ